MFAFLKSALRNKVIWYLFSRYATFALQFVTSIYIAVKLGAFYFGIWSFFLLLINIFLNINLGFTAASNVLFVQYKNDENIRFKLLTSGIILNASLIFIPLLAILVSFLFRLDLLAKYDIGYFLYILPFVVFLFHLGGFFAGYYRVRNVLIPLIMYQSLFPLVCFVMVMFFKGELLMNALAAGYLLTGICILLTSMFYLRISFDIDVANILLVVKKGLWLFLYNSAYMFLILSTKFIVSIHYSVEKFGYFVFAYNLAAAATLLVDSFLGFIYPKIIDYLSVSVELILQRIDKIRDMYILVNNMTIYFFLAVYYVCIDNWLTAQTSFDACAFILLTLCVLSMVFPYNVYLISHNKESFIAKNAALALIINIMLVSIFAFLLDFSYKYCIVGTLFANVFYVLATGFQALKLIGGTQQGSDKCSIRRRFIQIFPFRHSIPFVVAIFLLCSIPAIAGVVAFILLLVLNWRQVKNLFQSSLNIIRSPSILNIN